MAGMPSPFLVGLWLLLRTFDSGEPVIGEPPVDHGGTTGTGTGAGTGAGTSSGSSGGTTGSSSGETTSGGTASTGSGTSAGTDATSSTDTGQTSTGTESTSGTTDTGATNTPTDGGSFVDGDITGDTYGIEDLGEGCTDDDEDPGCCDSDENNSDNFCHISRHGRDRVAIAVLLVLLARPRRAR